MMFLSLAFVFAGVNKSFGQCTPDELHPAPGVEYTYSVAISGTTFDGDGAYYWYITQNPNVYDIDNGGPTNVITNDGTYFSIDATNGSPYATATGTSGTILVTWTSAAVTAAATNPFFLVLWYGEPNEAGAVDCSTDNVRAWQIDPINPFLLEIAGIADDLTTPQDEQCVAPVETAVITPGPTDNSDATINVTYGENTLYFEIMASGVLGAWRPSFRIPALASGQAYTSIDYSIDGGTNWISLGTAAGDLVGGTNATISDEVNGTPIYLRVVIDNENYESLTLQTLNFAVDGHLPTAYTVSDVVSDSDCTEASEFAKNTDYSILPRPTLTGTPGFMTKNP